MGGPKNKEWEIPNFLEPWISLNGTRSLKIPTNKELKWILITNLWSLIDGLKMPWYVIGSNVYGPMGREFNTF